MENATIAHELLRQARELAAQGENLYRVRAYRRAAAVVFGLDRPVSSVLAAEGVRGLKTIPGIGPSLAKTLAELAAPRAVPRAKAG
jgi:DNA polymerase/3'-5' exonuclease PolX